MKRQAEKSSRGANLTPAAAVQALIDRVKKETRDFGTYDIYVGKIEPKDLPAANAILALDAPAQAMVVREFFNRMRVLKDGTELGAYFDGVAGCRLSPILTRLLQRDLPFELSDLVLFLDKLELFKTSYPDRALPVRSMLRSIARFIDRNGLPTQLRDALQGFRSQLEAGHETYTSEYAPTASEKSCIDYINNELFGKAAPSVALESAEPWAAAVERDTHRLRGKLKSVWTQLLDHLHSANGTKPSNKWLKQTGAHIDALGRDRFRNYLTTWLPLTGLPRNDHPPRNDQYIDPNLLFSDASQAILKGLAWTGSLFSEPEVANALGDLGEACWKKVLGYGPRSKRAGNAVLWALSSIGTQPAIAQLVRINSRLKHASAKLLADKAMNRVAESTGQTREDMEELGFPTFNLDSNGTLAQSLGDFTCSLAITPEFTVSFGITDSAGKTRKSVPVDLKNSNELKLLRRNQKEIEAMLTVQRRRFESILRLPDRQWSLSDWRSRFVDHPILSAFARRLIWTFSTDGESCSAIFHDKQFLKVGGSRAEFLSARKPSSNTIVRLWHPVADTPEAVFSWRAFLERHQITQPFKQAHREVYLLTDAERRTGNYSNRFAAHILRQHQLNALCTQRGWTYRLQGAWDSGGSIPTLEIPALNLKVEFWVEAILGDDAPTSGAGVALHSSTDQVRFYRMQPHEQLALEQIHPQVFSELMRDVDLFVGVCSVANDPTWSDGGPNGHFRDYWQSVSFGSLSESAKTRKEILATLLPRLAIAGQCSLTDKYLRVQGSLRAYKIHLGSSNILMEPNDQYLCIVPDISAKRSATSNVYLPFDGDNMLGQIVSKAFLLARDEQITDPSITRQIRPG